jgi:hypothetical protein
MKLAAALAVGTPPSWATRHAADLPQESQNPTRTETSRRGRTSHIWRRLSSALPPGVTLFVWPRPGGVP